jgi:hypothetical protein
MRLSQQLHEQNVNQQDIVKPGWLPGFLFLFRIKCIYKQYVHVIMD